MLKALFGSTARVKILEFFLLYPDKKSSLRQLAHDFDLPASSLRYELENLVKFGILREEKENEELTEEKSEKKKKRTEKKYFVADTNFILYPEIKALLTKAQILYSQSFLDGLRKIGQPKFLALTGFFTNQSQTRTDILIVGHIRQTALLKLIQELEKNIGHEVNFTVFSEREFNYRREINDIFLYNIFSGDMFILINELDKK